MAEKTFLKFDRITKSFTRNGVTTQVLSDISFSIAKGEFVSIIGHSGCGKSTLLNLRCTTGRAMGHGTRS
jgi:nitrate/nitrite transport system ATP-binding protein